MTDTACPTCGGIVGETCFSHLGTGCDVPEFPHYSPLPKHPELTFLDLVEAETARARSLHAPYNSMHEGYAVLLEEVDEFWDEVRLRSEKRNLEAIGKELVQVASVARRIYEEVVLKKIVK